MESSASTAIPDPDEVLQHLDWVRSLATRLVRDPAEADDLRQEVWLLSQRLSRPARVPLKGWLGGILRNVVRERRRASRTRSLHEESSALERARATDTAPMVREISMQQVVLERLMELREPYLSTLLACYFEGLSHGEIAEREGVSLHAIRSRVQRGLGELREDLASLKSGGASALALLAFSLWDPAVYAAGAAAVAAEGAGATVPSGAGAGTKLAAVALAGGAVGAAALLLRGPTVEEVATPEAIRVAVERAPDASEAPLASSGARVAADPSEAAEAQAPELRASEPLAAARGTEVRVVDLDGQPVAGAQVAYLHVVSDTETRTGESARTDDSGRAMVEGVVGSGTFVCASDDLFQVGFPKAGESARTKDVPTAVVGPRTSARGRVFDPDGEPIQGARVRLAYRERFPGPVGLLIERSNQPEYMDTTGPDGAFEIALARSSSPLLLTVSFPGRTRHVQDNVVLGAGAEPIEVVLQAATDPQACFGRVVAPDGTPVPGAWVADGELAVRADADGVFDLGIVAEGATIVAGAPGYLTGGAGRTADLRGVEIELAGAPLRIEGHALYPDGRPAVGLSVRIVNPARVGRYTFSHAGRLASMPVTAEMFARPFVGYRPTTVAATTDETGAFVVEGLLRHDYGLEFNDPDSALLLTTPAYPAGARDVVVEVPEQLEALHGVVRTPEGQPLRDALVHTFLPSGPKRMGPTARTDSQGEFRFGALVPGTILHVVTDLPWVHTRTVVTEQRSLEITVEPAARVFMTLAPDAPALAGRDWPTSVFFLDAEGRMVPFVVDDLLGYPAEWTPVPSRRDGAVELQPMLVPARAIRLELATSKEPILALPLELAPGAEVHLAE